MDKRTVSTFLWILVTVIVMLSLVAVTSPFGAYIKNSLETFTGEYIEKNGSDSTEEEKGGEKAEEYTLTIRYAVPEDPSITIPEFKSEYHKYDKYNVVSPAIDKYTADTPVASGIITEDTEIEITYSLSQYEIKYITNEGLWNVPPTENDLHYQYQDTKPLKSDITRENYSFDGWYETSDFTSAPVSVITQNDFGDKTYYAKWIAKDFSITYNFNDTTASDKFYNSKGTLYYVRNLESGNSQFEKDGATNRIVNGLAQWDTEPEAKYYTYSYNTEIKFPVNVSKFGYSFVGWNTEKDGSGEYRTEITKKDAGNITLYAQWKPKTYTITYHLGFKNSNNEDATFALKEGEFIKTYTFGESSSVDGKMDLSKSITATGYEKYANEECWYLVDKTKFGDYSYYTNLYGSIWTHGTSKLDNYKMSCLYEGYKTTVPAEDGTVYCVYDYGDADLYTLPIPNEYYLRFEANAPNSCYTEETGNLFLSGTTGHYGDRYGFSDGYYQQLRYDRTQKIEKNGYSCVGYTFVGWNTEADGTGTSYKDEQAVKSLTPVAGEVITLYAQWKANPSGIIIEYYTQNLDNDNNDNLDGYTHVSTIRKPTELTSPEFSIYSDGEYDFSKDKKAQEGMTFYKASVGNNGIQDFSILSNDVTTTKIIPVESTLDTVNSTVTARVIRLYYTRKSYTFTLKYEYPKSIATIKTEISNPVTGAIGTNDYVITANEGNTDVVKKTDQITMTVKYGDTIKITSNLNIRESETRYKYTDSYTWRGERAASTNGTKTNNNITAIYIGNMPPIEATITLCTQDNDGILKLDPNGGTVYGTSKVYDKVCTFGKNMGMEDAVWPTSCYQFKGWYTPGGVKVSPETIFTQQYSSQQGVILKARWSQSPQENHQYTAKIILQPTCTKTGIKEYTCRYCGNSYTKSIPALGHSWGSKYVTSSATCVDPAKCSQKCKRCGIIQSAGSTGSALGHLPNSIGSCTTVHAYNQTNANLFSCGDGHPGNYMSRVTHILCGRNGTCTYYDGTKWCYTHNQGATVYLFNDNGYNDLRHSSLTHGFHGATAVGEGVFPQ